MLLAKLLPEGQKSGLVYVSELMKGKEHARCIADFKAQETIHAEHDRIIAGADEWAQQMPALNRLAGRMSAMRIHKGWSQVQAATVLGVSRAALSHYEVGRREPDLDTLIQIADAYDVTLDYLLGRVKEGAQVVGSTLRTAR